ncbi:hypothetical protein BT69DRAFT_1320138 [Atractiella rhizophila]|nr:hypothetical protein BT69DRAFT_1320138 [Atractiella rhizophila]
MDLDPALTNAIEDLNVSMPPSTPSPSITHTAPLQPAPQPLVKTFSTPSTVSTKTWLSLPSSLSSKSVNSNTEQPDNQVQVSDPFNQNTSTVSPRPSLDSLSDFDAIDEVEASREDVGQPLLTSAHEVQELSMDLDSLRREHRVDRWRQSVEVESESFEGTSGRWKDHHPPSLPISPALVSQPTFEEHQEFVREKTEKPLLEDEPASFAKELLGSTVGTTPHMSPLKHNGRKHTVVPMISSLALAEAVSVPTRPATPYSWKATVCLLSIGFLAGVTSSIACLYYFTSMFREAAREEHISLTAPPPIILEPSTSPSPSMTSSPLFSITTLTFILASGCLYMRKQVSSPDRFYRLFLSSAPIRDSLDIGLSLHPDDPLLRLLHALSSPSIPIPLLPLERKGWEVDMCRAILGAKISVGKEWQELVEVARKRLSERQTKKSSGFAFQREFELSRTFPKMEGDETPKRKRGRPKKETFNTHATSSGGKKLNRRALASEEGDDSDSDLTEVEEKKDPAQVDAPGSNIKQEEPTRLTAPDRSTIVTPKKGKAQLLHPNGDATPVKKEKSPLKALIKEEASPPLRRSPRIAAH